MYKYIIIYIYIYIYMGGISFGYVYIYIYIYIYAHMKIEEKQNNLNLINLLWRKANVKCFGFNKLNQDFDIMRIVHTAMDAYQDNSGEQNVYNEKIQTRA